MRYDILILSPVPACESDGVFRTIDLWARDLEAQCAISTVHLICPVQSGETGAVINSDIKIHRQDALSDNDLTSIVSQVDVVQLANSGWRTSAAARRLLKIARRLRRVVILGVSSNRAKSAWLNSTNRLRGALSYLDVRTAQAWFAFRADGVFVVGSGLQDLFKHFNKNIYVGIASWIRDADIAPPWTSHSGPLRVCMAARLEKMKGMHVGASAIAFARSSQPDIRLSIIGDGPERHNIERQVRDLDLLAVTTFQSTVSYPQPFLEFLRQTDLVLLTNLSDEQPRLVFDALSQGCIPICPDTPAYRCLGLDSAIFYKQGDAAELSRAIKRLADPTLRAELSATMRPLLSRFTIEHMHIHRAEWVSTFIRQKTKESAPIGVKPPA